MIAGDVVRHLRGQHRQLLRLAQHLANEVEADAARMLQREAHTCRLEGEGSPRRLKPSQSHLSSGSPVPEAEPWLHPYFALNAMQASCQA